jgi:putative hydrolase of the HAD superfamily
MTFMFSACLVDVYGTLLTCDFRGRDARVAELAGVDRQVWKHAYERVEPADGVGQVTRAEMYEIMLRTCGVKPRAELVRELVATDRDMLLGTARLFDDALPFLDLLRSRDMAIALVSNCGDHTRPLLTSLDLIELTDAAVLSCEVGMIKPSPRIFRYALTELGVDAADALFVDDQAAFCAGAEVAGVSAVQIVRDADELPAGAVRSLLDVLG